MTNQKKMQIAAMNAKGMSIEEISKATLVNAADVEAFLVTREAVPGSEKAQEPKKRTYNRMTPTLLEKAVKLRAEGLSCAKIADQLGVNRKTVEYHLRNNATNTKKESPRGDKETGEQKMIKMTMQDTVKAAEQCADALGCQNCPLDWCKDCARHFANYIRIKKEESASVAADTDSVIKEDNNSLSQVYNTTDSKKCQAVITMITELADDIISDEASDAEIAGFAGTIKGLCYALKAFIGGADNG